MRAGELRHQVYVYVMPKDIESGSTDGELLELSPSPVFASVQPYEPGNSVEERSISHRVTMRYHSEITLDSVLTFNGRKLYVKGLQNVDERNIELRLLCEEVS